MRTRVTLECTECKQRNYDTMKEKGTERIELNKYISKENLLNLLCQNELDLNNLKEKTQRRSSASA